MAQQQQKYQMNEESDNMTKPLLSDHEQRSEESEQKQKSSGVESSTSFHSICKRANCKGILIKTVCSDYYSLWNRWRQCDKCFKTLRGSVELWVCPMNHWMNYDLCVECQKAMAGVAKQEEESE